MVPVFRRRLPALVGSTGVSELVVDMFCGIGYFSLGALKKNKSEKLSHLFACDINPDALRVRQYTIFFHAL